MTVQHDSDFHTTGDEASNDVINETMGGSGLQLEIPPVVHAESATSSPSKALSKASAQSAADLDSDDLDSDDLDSDSDLDEDADADSEGDPSDWRHAGIDDSDKSLDAKVRAMGRAGMEEETEEDDVDLDTIEDILALPDSQYPRFTLAKNKARFLRMVSWYKNKQEWLEVAPLSGVSKLFKQQTKELVGIRASKLDYEMELETGTLTPSQRSYRRDELKMCKVHEKMAVNLIARMQVKIKSGRR